MRPVPRIALVAVLALWPAVSFGGGPEQPAKAPEPRNVDAAPKPAAADTTSKPSIADAAVKPAAPEAPKTIVADAPVKAAELNDTQKYCQNIAAAAADARFAWQRKRLNDLDAQLKQRIADLEVKEAAIKDFIARRDEIQKRASDTVVGIYAKMKPDAAAQQIAALDDDMAAAILAQLTQKQASIILNEIPADRAAKLITAISTGATMGKKT